MQAPRRLVWVWAALVPVLLGVGYGAWWLWSSVGDETPLQAVPLASLPGVYFTRIDASVNDLMLVESSAKAARPSRVLPCP